jgi:hypothetical protein
MRRGIVLMIGSGILATVAIVGTATCVVGLRHDYRQWKVAQRVKPGMPAKQAEQILGEPAWRDRCGAKVRYVWKKGCVAELGYPSAFAPIPPTYLIVQLNQRNQVISVDTIDEL